jgi:putative copper resistance protein D
MDILRTESYIYVNQNQYFRFNLNKGEKMSLLQFYSILHLLAVVTWIGGMIFVNLSLVPSISNMAPEQQGAVMGRVTKRFSIISMICILVLLITGFLKVPEGMLFAPASHYGLILLIKHILVLIAIIIGLYISFGVAPKIRKLAPKPGEAPSAEMISAQKTLGALAFTNMIVGVLIIIIISLR